LRHKTALCMLTWNRRKIFQHTFESFLKFHPGFKDIIIVDNGSTDGTKEYIKTISLLDSILLKRNMGAQLGKFLGWNTAVNKGFDFIIFLEDDHPCIDEIPISDLEQYLNNNPDVGYVRLNDKPYLNRHQISRMPIVYQEKINLNAKYKIRKSNYHFTCNPIMFRASLVDFLSPCFSKIEEKQKVEDYAYFKEITPTPLSIERINQNYGVSEKSYMKYFMKHYKWQAQLFPYCFHTVIRKRNLETWRN